MDILLIVGVYMICVALLGLNILSVIYMRQSRKPQAVIVWDGWTTELVRYRRGMVSEIGNLEVFGDGEQSLPLGLKGRGGQTLDFILVRRQQMLPNV